MFLEVVTSLFLLWVTWWIIRTYQERRLLPPGPIPLPIIGNLWQMRFGTSGSLNQLCEKYGDIFTVSLGQNTVVVVNSAELAREALIARNEDMVGRPFGVFYPLDIVLEGKDIVTVDYSPKLLFRRKVFRSAMHIYGTFGNEQANKRANEGAQTLVREIEKMNPRRFSPLKYVRSATISSLWQWLSSKKYPLDHPTILSLDEFIWKITYLPSYSSLLKLLPMTSYFPTKLNTYLKDVINIRERIFEEELRLHRETFSSGVTRDLTDSFLDGYEKEMSKESDIDIGSSEDVKGLMMDVTVAGVDTTSASISWFILYMVLNQDVQEKIHSELDEVVGRSRYPCWKDAENLHYFQATILEVMRHSSPAPLIQRNAFRDTTIGGYRIRRTTPVLLNVGHINRDPKYWQEPKKFRPNRFLHDNGRFVGWGTVPEFFPFGLGNRRCPGEPLAKMNVFSFLSVLLHRFKFQVDDENAKPTLEFTESSVNFPKDYTVCCVDRL